MITIGCVGAGFIGTAIRQGMEGLANVEVYDKYKAESSTCSSLKELCEKVSVIFVAVPTPMYEDGSCDISIMDSVLKEASLLVGEGTHTFCLKSTMVPGTTATFQEKYSNLNLVHNPEFLREATATEDFKNQDRIVLGGNSAGVQTMKQMYSDTFPGVPIVECSSNMSEYTKYVTNNFLTVKVAFANEVFEIAHKLGLDYQELINTVTLDKRLGNWGWDVPGRMAADGLTEDDLVFDRPAAKVEDGKVYLPGYSGSCFPKDINAMIAWCKANDVESEVISAAWEKNLRIRPERDWENLKGRAVSKKEE